MTRWMIGIGFLTTAILAVGMTPSWAQESPTAGNVAVQAPSDSRSNVTLKPGSEFDGPAQPSPLLKMPTGQVSGASGNMPGQDLVDVGPTVGRARLSAADTDNYLASKEFQESQGLYNRPSGKHTHDGAGSQFKGAGEGMLGELAIMGVEAAITGHLPDQH
jgi:hypothetical protein